jgi:hypothetical protein
MGKSIPIRIERAVGGAEVSATSTIAPESTARAAIIHRFSTYLPDGVRHAFITMISGGTNGFILTMTSK